jgi:3D-(3,5/4)-trihydroxycyclohexane-1,2-dione acylhydrolase (decyclizing)
VQGDALRTLEELQKGMQPSATSSPWLERARELASRWNTERDSAVAKRKSALPGDAEVIGIVNDWIGANGTVVCAAGGLPGELHKLWRTQDTHGYHVEYGYSCMGYEIAGGLGVKMALPDREVTVMVGDGSYLMLNSELATSIALGRKLIVVLLDNRGYGCINRLQQACGGDSFNNLLEPAAPVIDFVAHAKSLGAFAEKAKSIDELPAALLRARSADRTAVVVIDTDPQHSTSAGGAWWDVPIPEMSDNANVRDAYARYPK